MQMVVMAILLCLMISSKSMAVDPLKSAIKVSASGMQAQASRIKVITQNIANKDSTALGPGSEPYQRQILILRNKNDKKLQADIVSIKKYGRDKSPYKRIYDPNHPAADNNGFVLYPNVDITIENVDAKDASRTYEANLNMIDLSKNMYNKTLEILK